MRRLLLVSITVFLACHRRPPDRVLDVHVAVDEEFRKRTNWRELVLSRFGSFESAYKTTLALRFEPITTVEWDTNQRKTPEQNRRDLEKWQTGPDSLVVGLLSAPAGTSGMGLAVPGDGRVLVFDCSHCTETDNQRILAHQLLHVFGAWHSRDAASRMHDPPGGQFDAATVQAVMLTRSADLRFRRLAATALERLNALWSHLATDAIDPSTNPVYVYHLAAGNELLDNGRPAEAIEPLSRASSVAPRDAQALYALGAAHLSLRQFRDAASDFRRVLEVNPRSIAALTNLGGALLELKKIDEAAAVLQQACVLAPLDAAVQANAGVALSLVPGRLNDSIAHLREALRLDPGAQHVRAALKAALARQRSTSSQQR